MSAKHAISSLEALETAVEGGRIVLGHEKSDRGVLRAYENAMVEYEQYSFWRRGAPGGYREPMTLWLPQRRAVQFLHAYLASRLKAGVQREAALIKMPTGTGKTGVIAAMACVSPLARRTLILTPRVALVQQMRQDLCFKFWRKLGALYSEGKLSEGLPPNEIEERCALLRRSRSFPIRTLLSDHYKQIWDERSEERQIIVGTFNALHAVLGLEPPPHRSMYGRSARPPSQSLTTLGDDGDELSESVADPDAFRKILKTVELVVVDEGHYEPAYSWRQAVAALNAPTAIFTATPYRNDYKYFEINGRYVFNLSWQEAVEKKLVRNVVCEDPVGKTFGPYAGKMPKSEKKKPLRAFYSEGQFARDFERTLHKVPKNKKVIVHAATFGSLKRLQIALFKYCKTAAVLIHDRIAQNEKESPELRNFSARDRDLLAKLRFKHVRETDENDIAQAAQIWLHQYKLLEGIDNDSFVEIWLYDAFGSARQLVQQVGRAVRRPTLTDRQGQVATIRGSGMPIAAFSGAPTVAQQLHRRWKDYLAYEKYSADKVGRAFTAETQLLASLKRSAPDVQYIGGEFRGGHLLDESPTMAAFLVPRRGKVCRVDGVEDHKPTSLSDALLDKIQGAACEAMVLEERFDIVQVAAPDLLVYRDARLIRYLAWNSSRYLATHHLPEWRLGLMMIVRAGRYIFLLDTEGLCIDTSRLDLLAPEPNELQRLFPKTPTPSTPGGPLVPTVTRIVEATAAGLDTSEAGIRSMSIRKSALDGTYFDLAEAAQIPTSVRGTGPLDDETVRRRLSFFGGTVADATSKLVSVHDYVNWAQRVGNILADQTTEGHGFFHRFARQVPPVSDEDGAPQSILLDLWDILDIPTEDAEKRRWDSEAARALLEKDTCLNVVEQEDEDDGPSRYFFDFAGVQLELKYEHKVTIPPSGRYRIVDDSAALDAILLNEDVDEGKEGDDPDHRAFGRKLSASLVRYLNQLQSFRVVPLMDQVVYAHGHFYRPEINEDVLSIIEGCSGLSSVVSEKGDTRLKSSRRWEDQTLFGRVYSWHAGSNVNACKFSRELSQCELLVCDDRTRETADFFAINQNARRIFVIHAKAKEGMASASARDLQEVTRQAQTSLAFAGSVREALPLPPEWRTKWQVRLQDAGGAAINRPRLVYKAGKITPETACDEVNTALSDRRFTTEVVILTAGVLSASAAREAFNQRQVRDLQFLYLLASLRTSFDRAGVGVRIVANA